MDKYTRKKFQVEEIDKIREDACFHYVEGLQWVLSYYTSGPPSWSWYYPHHYAPFINDLVETSLGLKSKMIESNTEDFHEFSKNFSFEFQLGKPFTPFLQLLSVLPPESQGFFFFFFFFF